MYGKGKGCAVPSDGQAREKLALYVYEYLLHVGAQKSAQTFLSEIRWEKNITLGEPPGFLHSWWCVFWDLYCAAPDRRETCEHSSEAKAFHDYSAAAAPSPVMGNLPPSDGMAGGPMAPGFFQVQYPPVGVPGSQPLLPNAMDPAARAQGHPNMGGPMQRMNPPRGMGGMAPQTYGSGMRPPPSSLAGPGMPIAYSSSSPGNYVVSMGGALGGCAGSDPICPPPISIPLCPSRVLPVVAAPPAPPSCPALVVSVPPLCAQGVVCWGGGSLLIHPPPPPMSHTPHRFHQLQ
uniref:Single stranded DNA binding protein 4 n=1 Tax=Coturnix japonica TaxID=93934 RepID=A0A8C2TLV0_COTJA